MSSDRYYGYGHGHSGGRPLSYNPATTSVPTSIGYNSSMYAGDMHVTPSSSSSSRHHLTPRGYYTSTAPGGVPTTTRTFAVNHDSRSRPTRESSRTRRSTLDSTSRPPVIVTTSSHKDRANTTSSHSSGTRSANSPTRDYGQPSPNHRSGRHHGRTSSATYDDDYYRHRDSSLSRRDAEAYRNSRPSVVYPSDPRHSTAAVDFGSGDYGTDGYQYTNAGELARYDLDNPRASRRRRDSMDRGYYRPSLSYNTDQRSLNVNTSPDLSRNYASNTSRVYDGRGGPPPSTRGFDRINSRYENPRDGPQGASVPASPTASNFEVGGGPTRRGRPVSMYQDGTPRSSVPDDYYRAKDDERGTRDPRDREPDRPSSSGYHDDSVASRGFGLRTGPPPPPPVENPDRRRDPRPDEPAKRSDESLKRDSDTERRERPHERGASDDLRRERREGRRESDEEEKERTRLRDKVTGGLGIAAAAVGLGSAFKDDDKGDKDKEPQPRRRTSPSEDEKRPGEGVSTDAPRPIESDVKDRERRASDEELTRQRAAAEAETRDRMRRDAEDRLNGDSVAPASGSDTDEGRHPRRRHRPSNSFNPNDASDLAKIKEQLAAMKVSDKGRDSDLSSTARDESGRSTNDRSDMTLVEAHQDESRGRDASVSADGKQVRLVSPPRDKRNDKPVRGILKQPSAAFPEDANPIREGVAPHKEDKKLKEVPAGARWTKISRRKVNPEALEIGKERFEVRDDFVIVLRVLSAEEIQAYASATQILRERRRNKDRDPEKDREEDDGDDSKRRHHRHRDEEDEDKDRERDRDTEKRSRRHKRTGEDDDYDESHHHHHNHHQRSFRERERERDRGRERDWALES